MSYMTTSERQSLLSAELAVAGTRGLFAQALGRVATAFGLAHATLMHAPSPEDLLLKPLLIESSLPAAYVRDFDRANMMRGCPFGLRLRESAVPLAWHLNDVVNGQAFPAELRALMLHHAIPAGVAMPTIAVDGRRLVFWFCGERAALGQSEVNELAIIILHALDAYNTVRRNEESAHNALSARELEVVRWTAQGKTSIEIGQILTLSDHTVNAYMTNAIKKLDCVNRTQLVAKAIRLKLIN
ncbi:LuxR family transcriptional regulator protein [Rhizobium phaseoli]|uniref:Autoinducer binding domain-containing protein n=2 Tax=Rhizobium TaxID=379 RepID=A0A192TBT6_9HYPH|nr:MULTISPECIES: LuxR family transcriptional regulator [Rhizobium]ACE92187.1 probable transcriptional regulator protein, LuxR family [Rhizobium etli CIAT 652]EGE56638.1 putative transcriptional regulator protein, LuxR family [Rhizobium etli CNPAF512]ANL29027.1 LuxR family transcriptional regulator protein [Rhizobium phaseoli]ANL41593.1 LuxR family transcriptional regulator protein [Rhizobium phaseoli]ANL54298.1 LuxR family transcriptional regulator protein [Rhizobium phaseoli]